MTTDTQLTELIINTLSPEQFEPITPSDTEIYLVEDDAEYVTAEELATKQDKLSFVITEDMFDLEFDATKGVAPYSTSYGYTNVTIHDNVGVEWVEGASYTFVLDTKVSTSANRNVRVRIGESGDWKPIMVTSAIAAGSTVFIKAINPIFFYKTVYQPNGALHTLYDTNTTYTMYTLIDSGQHIAGAGTYAVTRYSLCMQKPDMTWEKVTATNANYSTGTTKTVNTNGFLLNRINYYSYTNTYANGAKIGTNYMYSQINSIAGSYSFNCGTAPGWAVGDYIYLVGTLGADGLFYLDETKWWDNKLPTTNDGKLYIQLGIALTTTDSTMSFYADRPIFYHDGTEIKQYIPNDKTKADVDTPSIQAPYIKTTYENGTSGYIVWSNGYCEQWGISSTNFPANVSTTENVHLLKRYKSTSYIVTVNKITTTTSATHGVTYNILGDDNFNLNTNNSVAGKISWSTKGYLAEGEY